MHSPRLPVDALAATCTVVVVRWIDGRIRAGFPSPADDYDCHPVDIGRLLVKHPQATFLVRASGLSMVAAGINDGDILVVDRAITPQHGLIVCAVVDGHFTVKYLHRRNGRFRLVAADPTFPDIVPHEGQTIEVWGVVTSSITRLFKL